METRAEYQHTSRALWRAPLLVFALALLVTTLLLVAVTHSARQADRASFESETVRTTNAVRERVDTTITLLQGTAGLFAASRGVEPAEFDAYVMHLRLRERYPGILGIGFSERIPAPRRARREQQLRAAGLEGFRIWPDTPREEYHSIVYLQPLDERNRAAIGFDMHTEPVRREAMQRARDEGAAAASGRVYLVQETSPQRQSGILIYIPVYRSVTPPRTMQDRRQSLVGYVYAPLRIDDLLQGVRGVGPRQIDYELYDGGVPSAETLLRSTRQPDVQPSGLRATRSLEVAGRTWRLDFSARASFDGTSQWRLIPWLGAVSLAACTLLAWITFVQARARRQAEAAAAQRRLNEQALQASQAREHQRAERLQELYAELRESDRRKDEFLAVLAHELRNPLAPIRSAQEILKLSPHGPAAERAREITERQVRVMVRLIDDLLDVSRISRGKINLQRQPTRIANVIQAAIETSRPLMEARNHRLEIGPLDPDAQLDIDPDRVAQVVTNLLNNAATYTPPGGEIRVGAVADADGVRISVRDNGIGIAADQLGHVFELFRQLGRSPAGGGLGIGLSLSARLVELHGGRIEVNSEGPGRGSEFIVLLPRTEQTVCEEPTSCPAEIS